ncbi:MAG: glycosyltransferase [Dongiaceae bacterium]
MKLVIFGLAISSSWGNGHAALWRALCDALIRRGHRIVFLERDVPWYAEHRDLTELPGGDLILYPDWASVLPSARAHVRDADAAIVTSYSPDALAAEALLGELAPPLAVFYDLDTPVTLDRLARGETVAYVGPHGLAGYDLVLSYTGGAALDRLRERLGARRVLPLNGSVDPALHRPVAPVERYRADLSYIGTYAEDRQAALEALLIEPARRRPALRFVIAGAQYPQGFPWTDNIYFVRHLPPGEHAAFYSSSRLTLNVTRAAMAALGHCPSGRLFEAAACGAALLSDWWEGLDAFFAPGREILLAGTPDEAVAALERSDAELAAIGRAARERALDEHTADRRADALEAALSIAWQAAPEPVQPRPEA